MPLHGIFPSPFFPFLIYTRFLLGCGPFWGVYDGISLGWRRWPTMIGSIFTVLGWRKAVDGTKGRWEKSLDRTGLEGYVEWEGRESHGGKFVMQT